MSAIAPPKPQSDPRSLTGAEKVAVLLLALSQPKAAQLLTRFDPEEIRCLARSARALPPVSAADLSQLVEEFAAMFSGGVKFTGTAAEIRTLLKGVLSEDELAAALSDDAPAAREGQSDSVWGDVARVKDDAIRNFLAGEHPQTIALILTRLDGAIAARIIATLPSDLRNSLLCRMLSITRVARDASEALERTMREELITLTSATAGAHASIANILNRLDKRQLDSALQLLSEVRPSDVRALRGMLFSFEELGMLEPSALALVINQVPVERLVPALSRMDAAFQGAVLAALSARTRRMVESDLQSGSEVAPRDVAEARRAIVDVVMKLAAQGQIELPSVASGEPPAQMREDDHG